MFEDESHKSVESFSNTLEHYESEGDSGGRVEHTENLSSDGFGRAVTVAWKIDKGSI